MGTFEFTQDQFIDRPRPEVFRFFSDPHNLATITPEWLEFRILTPGPIEMTEGTVIDYALRIHGIPLKWRSRITHWEPPFRFIDEQTRGPYRRWIHTHTFTAENDGTRINDEVRYALFGGLIAHRFVRPDIERIFGYRQRKIGEIMAQDTAPSGGPAL